MKFPKQFETLGEKVLYFIQANPMKREDVVIEQYKTTSIRQELWGCTSKLLMKSDDEGVLHITKLGEEMLKTILRKDMTKFSQKRVLSAFRAGDHFSVRDVLFQLRVEETASRVNTVRTRLRALIGLGKIVRIGLGEKTQILYAKATNEIGQSRLDSVGLLLKIRKVERDKQIAITKHFQTALPGTLTGAVGQGKNDILRDKVFGRRTSQ